MELQHLYALPPARVSFEFFPPKTEQAKESLIATVKELATLAPEFVSVTYGAGGSTRQATHETVAALMQEGINVAAHLTCIGATRQEIDEIADEYYNIGVRHIVALRGDPPKGETQYRPHPGGYEYGVDLVRGLKDLHADFEISVPAFPEKHPESGEMKEDIDVLKAKMDAGATRAITQYFFDVEHFFRFRDMAAARGVTLPIIPGILIISNVEQFLKFNEQCGAHIPEYIMELLKGLDEAPKTREVMSAIIAAELCRKLRSEGVEQFHFYTLNRAPIATAICKILGKY